MQVVCQEVHGFKPATIAVRLSFNSNGSSTQVEESQGWYISGDDHALLLKLIKNGDSHAKVMRFVQVWLDIRAPRYWWAEFATYCVGVTTMSESTIHTLSKHPITEGMFEYPEEHIKKQTTYFMPEFSVKDEEWQLHPYYPIYLVSNKGRVRRLEYNSPRNFTYKEKWLQPIIKSDKYLAVSILTQGTNPNSRKLYAIHRLVAETFIPNLEVKKEVNHKDGNKQNNSVENLEWCSRSENAIHAYNSGLQNMTVETARKISKANLKFDEDMQEEIRNAFAEEKVSFRVLADRYDCSHSIISEIVKGVYGDKLGASIKDEMDDMISRLEELRLKYVETGSSEDFMALKRMLPESFLQRRIVNLNYQVLRHIYLDRKGHRLPEWKTFLDFLDTLPFPEFIKEER